MDDAGYGYLGTMRTQPGARDQVVALLLEGQQRTTMPGCRLYVISTADTDPDLIWVNEVWDTKESHDASLQIPEVRATIAQVMPLLTGEFTRQETRVAGGLGLP